MAGPQEDALSTEAEADLTRLDTFLRLKNPPAADRLLATLSSAFDRLSLSPQAGRPSLARPGTDLRERIVRFGQSAYVILYRVEPASILIIRVFHAREDR